MSETNTKKLSYEELKKQLRTLEFLLDGYETRLKNNAASRVTLRGTSIRNPNEMINDRELIAAQKDAIMKIKEIIKRINDDEPPQTATLGGARRKHRTSRRHRGRKRITRRR